MLDAASLFVTSADLTQLAGRQIQRVNPLVAEGVPVRIVFARGSATFTVDRRPGTSQSLTVAANGSVDVTFGLSIQSIVGVFRRRAFRNGEAGPQLNNWLLPATALVNNVVTGVHPGLGDGAEVVMLVRDAALGDHPIEYAPGTTTPLTVTGDRIALDLDLSGATLEDVVTVGAGEPGHSAMLRVASRFGFNPDTGVASFADLNPLVSDGTPVRVEWTDASNVVQAETAVFGEFEFEDTAARAGRLYRYDVTAMRSVALDDARSVEVLSQPATLTGVACRESGAPEIGAVEAAWVTALGAVATTAEEAESVRVTAPTAARCAAMLLRLRPGDRLEFSSGWTDPASFDALADSFVFAWRDAPDAGRPPSLHRAACVIQWASSGVRTSCAAIRVIAESG